MNVLGVIFDLDGVLVNTSKYHLKAWTDLARDLGVNMTPSLAKSLKGVSRIKSLDLILEQSSIKATYKQKINLANKKNEYYLNYISNIDENDILDGALEALEKGKKSLELHLGHQVLML
ncbi:HAD hydrolase-like protein [Tepidibacillus infernus]|uniref:HAD hydrolase-like protein n=1 Tax=Tepidibacillus infernus TaxID=1806172 RepID=UPI003B6BD324